MYSRKSIIKKTRKKKLVERGKFLARKTTVAFALFLFLAGILAWQSGNEKVTISKIEIFGNEVVNEKVVREIVQKEMIGKYGWLFHKNNIFIYPRGDIEKKLFELNKRIKEVNVYRDSLTAIAVEISERKPAYLYCTIAPQGSTFPVTPLRSASPQGQTFSRDCFFLDKTGYIFAEAPQFSGNVFFEFYADREFANKPLGNLLFEEKEFDRIIVFKEKTEKLGFKAVALVEKEEGDYDLFFEDGAKIMFNKKQNLAEVLENLDSSIETIQASTKPLEYIDLRFGNKVFYKFK